MAEIKELKLHFVHKQSNDDRFLTPIESAKHAYHLFHEMDIGDKAEEKFACFHLTDKYEILCYDILAVRTRPDPMKILREALINISSRILIIHNRPFNPPEPSMADVRNARDLKEKGKILKIRLQDEIIIGDDGFISLAERGLI
jgi:DNA repair protein RadC